MEVGIEIFHIGKGILGLIIAVYILAIIWRISRAFKELETREIVDTLKSYVFMGFVTALIFSLGALYVMGGAEPTGYASEVTRQSFRLMRELVLLAAACFFLAILYEGAKEADLKRLKRHDSSA